MKQHLIGIILASIGFTLLYSGPAYAAENVEKSVKEFVSEELPTVSEESLSVDVEFTTVDRTLDVLIALLFIGLLLGMGFWLKKSLWNELRPVVFTSVCLGVLMFTAVNPLFWELKGVSVDTDGLTLHRYTLSDLTIAWEDVESVEWNEGHAFPTVTDDTSLRFISKNGEEYDIPRFVPQADELAVFALKRLQLQGPPK